MAVTTRNQRFALLSAARPWVSTLPEPSAGIDTGAERQQLIHELVLGVPAVAITGSLQTGALEALAFVGAGIVVAANSRLGTLAQTLAPLTGTATGLGGRAGGLSVLLAPLTCTAAGTAPLLPLTGSAAITLDPVTVQRGLLGLVAVTLDPLSGRGSGISGLMPIGPRRDVRVIRRRVARW